MPELPEEQIQNSTDPFQRDREAVLVNPKTDVVDKPKSVLDQIDDNELSVYILNLLRNDISDKEEMTWKSKRQYDINSYYGIKRPTNFPWPNASNFPVPLTSTLVDTAHSNLLGSIYFDPHDTVDVEGIGPEDKKKSKDLESLINWQMYSEIDSYNVMDRSIFLSLLHGTSFIKVVQGLDKKIKLSNVPMENIYLPLDSKGMQIEDTDHVFEIVGLTDNDIEERKILGVYEGLDEIPKGFNIRQGSMEEITTIAKDIASGTKLDQKSRRDLRYIMECYLTYWWKPKDSKESDPKQPIELIVWLSPNGAKIHRKVENRIRKRPYIEWKPYPRDDRFWGMSLPEKIRFIQEELDYSHNQNINAADISILPPGFYSQGSDFDPEVHKRVPGGMYPMVNPRDANFQPISVNPIFERQEDKYWDLAERLTGLTELFQGRNPPGKQTATLTVRRENRAEIRFKTLYQRYENSWDKMIDLIYFYDNIYFNDLKDKVIRVVGITESFKKAKDLFPQGLEGNYNFKFSSSPISEKEAKKNSQTQLAEFLMGTVLVQGDIANQWRVAKMFAEAVGEKDLELIVSKPREVNIASPEEAIQRIMGGELDFVPDPGIDADNYILRLQMFFKTDSFAQADQQTKGALMILLRRVTALRQGQIRAMLDSQIINRGPQNGTNGTQTQAPVINQPASAA